MKIVMFTPYYQPVIGGITNYTSHLTDSLRRRNNKVIVITRYGDNKSDVYALNTNKLLFSLKSFIKLFNIKPDVIHSHGGWYTLLPGVMYKFFSPSTKLIQSEHTQPESNMNRLTVVFVKFLYSHCDWLTYDSDITPDILSNYFTIPTKHKKIYGGAFVSKITREDIEKYRQNFGLDDKDYAPIIAYMGPFAWEMKAEGVKKLIMAFQYVLKKEPNSLLVIIGDGQYRKRTEDFANSLKLSKNIIFSGFVEKPHALLASCDIYAHISLMDSLPLSILESMLLRLPVIATKVGDIPELITDNFNGILVDANEISIANSILDLWHNPDKIEKISKNGKELAEKKYSWDRISQIYLDIYNQ
ncbi:MAG: glycosyltransferase family 4 protein [Methanosarcina sp.]